MKLRRAAALSAALVLVGATAASAAGPPYTVAVGGNSALGTETVQLASTGPVTFTLPSPMTCSSVTGTATINRGIGVNPVATITSTTWSGCQLLGAMTVQQQGAWSLFGTGGNATAGQSDQIAGFISPWSTTVRTANPTVCNFVISGTASTVIDEAAQQIRVQETASSGNLKTSRVSGCLGRVPNNGSVGLSLVWNITSPNGAVNLS